MRKVRKVRKVRGVRGVRKVRGVLLSGLLVLGVLGVASTAMAEVKVERVTYLNQPNCIRLSNGTVEVVITTAIGPRVIRYAFIGGDNILLSLIHI